MKWTSILVAFALTGAGAFADGPSFQDDVDDYWEDDQWTAGSPGGSSLPAPQPVSTDPQPVEVSRSAHGTTAVRRMRFASAAEAERYTLVSEMVQAQQPRMTPNGEPIPLRDQQPFALEQRGEYVVMATGADVSNPQQARAALNSGFANLPNLPAATSRFARLPGHGFVVTSSSKVAEFTEKYKGAEAAVNSVLADRGGASHEGDQRTLWLADDPTLAAGLQEYAEAFLGKAEPIAGAATELENAFDW